MLDRRVVICLTLALGVGLSACKKRGGVGPRHASAGKGKPISLTLPNFAGGELRLEEFRGKPLVILFFTSWCTVCQLQATRLHRVRAALGNRVALLGISLDLRPSLARAFVSAAGFNFPVAYGGPKMVRGGALGRVFGVPRLVVLDAKGRPVADHQRVMATQALFDQLKALVPKKKARE